MARTPQDITDAELSVMQVLWDNGPATIRQLTDALYADGTAAQYATVQKLLERLEDKQFVSRDRRGAAHTFTAAVGRDDLIGLRLRDVAAKLCGGSLTPLLTHLVRTKRLSTRERHELRALIEELDKKSGNKGETR
jgi:BlaI family transcriptional regulator, penicillinase repressor